MTALPVGIKVDWSIICSRPPRDQVASRERRGTHDAAGRARERGRGKAAGVFHIRRSWALTCEHRREQVEVVSRQDELFWIVLRTDQCALGTTDPSIKAHEPSAFDGADDADLEKLLTSQKNVPVDKLREDDHTSRLLRVIHFHAMAASYNEASATPAIRCNRSLSFYLQMKIVKQDELIASSW